MGSIAFLRTYRLTTSSGKHLEGISHAHIVSSMYKLITSAIGFDDLSVGFDRSYDRRQRKISNNKNIKGKVHVRVLLKDVFGFAEHEEKTTYGLGYILTFARNSDTAVLNKDNAINNGKIEIKSFEWYIPPYTPSILQQAILSKQILCKVPRELDNVERSVFLKELNIQISWTFELGTKEGLNIPIWINVGFQQQDRQDSQNLNNDTLYRPPVTSGQCIFSLEKSLECKFILFRFKVSEKIRKCSII